ncbi:MAG: S9 family peptidase [Acidobacteria bacterium]|nr:S9 family peptidase [Acidobacteriota bacterium]
MAQNKPPIAAKKPKIDKLHGETRVDNYYWLREKTDPEVISYLEAENAYTDSIMKPYEAFQENIYKEIVGKIKETDLSVPYRRGNYFYYNRTEQGKQYGIFCRKEASPNAQEEILLDLNEMGKGLKFISLGDIDISPDGKKLAYSTDTNGFRQYKMFIKDLETGKTFPETRERITSIQWANDNKTVFYVTEDAQTKRANQLYRHILGQEKDDLVYEEKDELYGLGVYQSSSKAYIFATSSSSTTSESRYLRSDDPNGSFKLLMARQDGHEYYPDHHSGDSFYIRTNLEAKNFRLVNVAINDLDVKNWREIIPHREPVTLEGVQFFVNHYVVYEREDGLQKMRVTDLRSGSVHQIQFPDPIYAAFPNANAEFNTSVFRFSYQSFVTPNSVFDYNLDSRERQLLKQDEVVGGYDSSQYNSERIYATATDGTRIPISVVYKKDLVKDGSRPLYLTGYGAYGASNPATFSVSLLSLLNRGVIFARAHIRGGGDLGQTWHDQGKMMLKRNTFTDFINCAEHLINEKYTGKDRLVIQGGSAGGLLIGAVINMRPELFKAAIAEVPFVDVINTMLDETLPLTVGEFLEWGNPKVKNEYDYLKSYCPYTNIAAKAYPNILVKTSLNDSQVMYWEPAKYVAKLRATKIDNNLLMLKTNLAGGHGGSSGRYDRFREVAFNYAFILTQVGITQ